MKLFCPKCGKPLVETPDGLTCIEGDMVLTPQMERDLSTTFGSTEGVTDPTPLRFKVGGTWFCPACSQPMIEENGCVSCAQCGKSLNRYVYQLVERHPHV